MSAIALSTTRARQLQYPPEGLREDLLLLEVDDQLLADVAKHGVVIKGDPNDTAVLCTADRTYAIKRVETTNTLLLVPPDGHRPQSAFPPTQQQQQPTQGTPLPAGARPSSAADATPARDSATAAAAATPGAGPAPTPPGVGLQTQLAAAEEGVARSLPIVARAVARAHLEVAPTAPRLGALERLLDERPYGLADEDEEDGENEEEDDLGSSEAGGEEQQQEGGGGLLGGGGGNGGNNNHNNNRPLAVAALHDPSPPPRPGVYSFARLLARVQASPAELKAALKELGAVRLGGGGGGDAAGAGAVAAAAGLCCWRRVDPTYSSAMLEMALATAAAEGWPLDALPLRAMQREMRKSGYRPRLVRHCLELYGERRQQQRGPVKGGAPAASAAAAAPAAAAGAAAAVPATVAAGASATPADAVGSCPAGTIGSLRPPPPPPPAPTAAEILFSIDARRVCLLFARRLLVPGGWGGAAAEDPAAAVDPASAPGGAACAPGPARDMAQFFARWRADVRRAAGGSGAALAGLRPVRAMLVGEALAEGDGGWWWGAEDGDEEDEGEEGGGGAGKKGGGVEEEAAVGMEEDDGQEEDGEKAAGEQKPPPKRRRKGPARSRPPEGATLRLFPADALPVEAEARFAALFAARPRWLRRDLEPYLVALTRAAAAAGGAGASTADALLLRHARASQRTPAEPVTYSAR